jgi:hypothetical protein
VTIYERATAVKRSRDPILRQEPLLAAPGLRSPCVSSIDQSPTYGARLRPAPQTLLTGPVRTRSVAETATRPLSQLVLVVIVVSVALVLTFDRCASTSKTYDAQGREAYTLNCSGWARS